MKIAMIGHKQVPSRRGGVEVVVEELATRMAVQGHRVDIYNRWCKGIEMPKEYKGVRIYHIPTFRSPAFNAPVSSFLAVLCAIFRRYDVIHIHAEGPGAMTIFTRLFRIPSIVSIHGLDWQRRKWGRFASGYLKWAEKVSAKNADEITTLSEGTRQYFLDTYGRETHLIRNGLIIKEYKPPKLIHSLGVEKDNYILFLARIVPEKGLHYLLKAFRKLETDKKLVIAGEIQPDSAYIQEICQLAKEDPRVILAGFVAGRLWEELYSNCCLYVLPSELEGMALSLLEALGYGAVCLVSDIEENHGIAEDYLHFFKKGDINHLAQQLEILLKEEKDEEKKKQQILWMKEHYSWDGMTKEMVKIYRKVLKNHENTNGK